MSLQDTLDHIVKAMVAIFCLAFGFIVLAALVEPVAEVFHYFLQMYLAGISFLALRLVSINPLAFN